MRFPLTCGLPLLLLLSGCQLFGWPDDDDTGDGYVTGKNRYTTMVDGDEREYFVHVPHSYDPGEAVPVVFMLHGTSGDGERFYNISGWTEVGDAENILTIYPSSWRYCIIDEGVVKNTTKWNSYLSNWAYCANETPRDDIKFLKQIISEINQRFNVDGKRVYLAGFSNGGQMAGRCSIEMSDFFAAIVEASGTLPADTTFVPNRKLPVIFQVGSADPGMVEIVIGDGYPRIPMSSFDSLLTSNPLFRGVVETQTSTFGLTSTFAMTGNPNVALTATFEASPANPEVEFRFVLIKDLEHNYPNGSNHPVKGAEVHWNWMKQFALP